MSAPPRDSGLDNSLALLREGYEFIGNRCRRLGTDVFETRLIGQRTIQHMQRAGAMPAPVKKVLLGKGGVQGLDGMRHRQRKAMFMELMSRRRLDELTATAERELRRQAATWPSRDRVVLLDELEEPLWRAACAWAGVPLVTRQDELRGGDMNLMVVGGGSVGLKHWQGHAARWRSEAWIADLVKKVRDGRLDVPEAAALAQFAQHRDPEGHRLSPRTVAVELLSVLRTTVALKYYLVFVAHALHQHPEARAAVVDGGDDEAQHFVQEVRRSYAFFPFTAARVRESFAWRDWDFPHGRRVMLDLYGTTHDPRLWEEPNAFRPERFAGRAPNPFDLIPQGGGSHDVHHRCAGEWITLDLMKMALGFFTGRLTYQVPRQDLTIPLNRFPTWPNSGFSISSVRLNEVGAIC